MGAEAGPEAEGGVVTDEAEDVLGAETEAARLGKSAEVDAETEFGLVAVDTGAEQVAGAEMEAAAAVAVVGIVAVAETKVGTVAGVITAEDEASSEVETAVARADGGARAAGVAGARRAVEPEPLWALLDSSTEEGEDLPVMLLEALVAFATSVEVAVETGGGGQSDGDPGSLCGIEGQEEGEEWNGRQNASAGNEGETEGKRACGKGTEEAASGTGGAGWG